MTEKISDTKAREILRLHETQMEVSEIAQLLNLKKMQVTAIIAYFNSPENDDESVVDSEATSRDENEIVSNGIEDLDASAIIEEYSTPVEAVTPASIPERGVDEPEKEKAEGIFIGNDKEYRDALYWNPQDAARVQNPHMMIVGESGSGKTYAVQCLTAELAQRGLPAIIIDYAQGFELDSLDDICKKYVNVSEYRVGEEGISLNPQPKWRGELDAGELRIDLPHR